MSSLNVLSQTNPMLRLKSDRVVEFGPVLKQLAADMVDTMRQHGGVGLAAPQVGVTARIIAVCVDAWKLPPVIMVNPVITAPIGLAKLADMQRSYEGCLSFDRSYWGRAVKRCKRIKVAFQDIDGNVLKLKTHGLVAAIIQHEIDHLDGILFTDYPDDRPRTLQRQPGGR